MAIARVEGDGWRRWPETGGVYSNLADVCIADGLALAVGGRRRDRPPSCCESATAPTRETSYGNELGTTQSCCRQRDGANGLVARTSFARTEKGLRDRLRRTSLGLAEADPSDAASKTIWAVGSSRPKAEATRGPSPLASTGRRSSWTRRPTASEPSAVWIDPETRDAWAVAPAASCSSTTGADGTGSIRRHRRHAAPRDRRELEQERGSRDQTSWRAGTERSGSRTRRCRRRASQT